jgi:hypothetical protein
MLNLVKTIAYGMIAVASAAPREYADDDLILTNRADKVVPEQIEKLIEISHYQTYSVLHKFALSAQKWSERS